MRGPFRRLLVGISDPGRSNRGFLDKVAGLARRSGGRVHLVHACPVAPTLAVGKQLEKMAALLRRRKIRVDTHVVNDMPPHEALVRQVRLRKADLLLVELHRHPRWTRWFVTYTDWELIRNCPCPVWLVKTNGSRTSRIVAAAVDPMHARAHAAKLDDRILEMAKDVAKLNGGRVALCHVADLPFTYEPGGLFGEPIPVPASREVQQRHLERVQKEIGALARRHKLPASQRTVLPGLSTELLPRMVRKLRANVLVMGAVSRSGLDRLFMGSTAERIIDRVQCDLLIVKPRSFRSTVPARQRPVGIAVP